MMTVDNKQYFGRSRITSDLIVNLLIAGSICVDIDKIN